MAIKRFQFFLVVTDTRWEAFIDPTASEKERKKALFHAEIAVRLYNPKPGNWRVTAMMKGLFGELKPYYLFQEILDPDFEHMLP